MRELDAALACFDAPSSLPDTSVAMDIEADMDMDMDMDMDGAFDHAPPDRSETAANLAADSSTEDLDRNGRPSIANFASLSRALPLARMLGADSHDHARAQLVWLAWGTGVTALLGLIDATTSAIRLSRGGAPLTGTEIVLSTLGSLGLLVMPTWLFGHYVSTRVWSSTPRVIETVRRLRRVLFAGLVTYAAGTLLLRVFASVLSSDVGSASSAGWGLLMVCAAAVAGARTGWRELQRSAQQL
jgi:hypothetical protein